MRDMRRWKEFVALEVQQKASKKKLQREDKPMLEFPEDLDDWFGETVKDRRKISLSHRNSPVYATVKRSRQHKREHHHTTSTPWKPVNHKPKPALSKFKPKSLVFQPCVKSKRNDETFLMELCADIDFESEIQLSDCEVNGKPSPIIQKSTARLKINNTKQQPSQELVTSPKVGGIGIHEKTKDGTKVESTVVHVPTANAETPCLKLTTSHKLPTPKKKVMFTLPDQDPPVGPEQQERKQNLCEVNKYLEQLSRETENFRNWFQSGAALSSEDEDSDFLPLTQNIDRF